MIPRSLLRPGAPLFSGLTCTLLLLLFPALLAAQVQSIEEFFDRAPGERIFKSHEVIDYLEYLEHASDRVTLQTIGTTWNRKRQVAAIVTHPENHARIGQIRRNAALLDDSRSTTREEAEAIIETQPAILYLAGSIHGFELSGAEGLMMLLSHFVTADDQETIAQLRNTVMVIDPIINSDGRDAFAQFNHQHIGRTVNPDPADWNNDFNSWEALRYRTSHYYFDLNRDWFAHTHPETHNRAALVREWRPQAGVDAHEMGPEIEFYVDPPTDPRSPWFPPFAAKWLEEYGRAHAEGFDRAHVDYTKRELFNFFYPAYFSAFFSYQGAAGMLYEQGSTRGPAWRLSDGTVRTLADAASNQYTAFRSMVRMSSERREEMLRDYYEASASSIEEGGRGTVRYLIEPSGDPHLAAEAVNLLRRSGIEVQRLTETASLRNVADREGNGVGTRSFEAGTWVIEAAQPRMHLIRNLLEPHIPVPEAFLEQARERLDRGENPRFYDITAWSLPLLFNLQGYSTTDGRSVGSEPVFGPVTVGGGAPSRAAAYAYLVDGSQARLLSLIHPLREEGVRLRVIHKPTRIGGTDYSSGTLVILTDGESERVHRLVSELAERHDLRVDATDSGIADPGHLPLGTVEGNRISKPEIALLGDTPLQAYSFGWAWHTLDRQYEIPHTILRPRRIASTPIERFDVIVMPAVTSFAEMNRTLGEGGVERLQRWVRDGGTLVTIGSATDYVREELELTALRSWYDAEEHEELQRVSAPGAFFSASLDGESWLTGGYEGDLPVLVNSPRVYADPEGPPSFQRRVPVRIASAESHISGHAWQENLERLPGSIFLYEERIGQGRVIGFAEDVNLRGYWRGADRLFLNAVLLGPSAP